MQWRGRGWLGIFLLVCGCLPACTRALWHKVHYGETLSEIGQFYGVPYLEIARLNNIRDPDRIFVGQRLRIPRGGREQSVPTGPRTRSVAVSTPPRQPAAVRPFPQDGDARFIWPVQGRISSHFGPRNRSFHDGIDIAAPLGTPVVAAATGQIIFSDTLRGYGKVVIVRHHDGYVTVYAHNHTNYVREGQIVQRGQRLADVGQTGRATGPNLHFEIRRDNRAQDPLRYLSQDYRTVRRSR